MIMVSACLMGKKCRYDGGSKPCERIIAEFEGKEYILICPEADAGLTSPRRPCEIVDGDGRDVLAGRACVMSEDGCDMTHHFVIGALRTVRKATEHKPERIILKSKSPSCGCGGIHDGSFSGKLREGDGVTAALLKLNGFEVETEQEV